MSTKQTGFTFKGCGEVVRVERFETKNGKLIFTLVVKTNGDYPQMVPVKMFGRLGEEFSTLKPGTLVDIDGELGGRDWKGKIYGDNVAKAIVVVDGDDGAVPSDLGDDPGSIPF